MQVEKVVWVEDSSREPQYKTIYRQVHDKASSMQQQAYDYAGDARDKARHMGEQAYQHASQGAQYMGDEARHKGEQAYQGAQSMRDAEANYGQQVYEKGQEAYRQATGSVAHAGHRAAEQFSSATENVMQGGEKLRDAVKGQAEHAKNRVAEPFHRAADSATGYWQQLANRVRRMWNGGEGDGDGKAKQRSEQMIDAEWLEQHARTMFDDAMTETKRFWQLAPPFNPDTMDPNKYIEEFQREMVFRYTTLAGTTPRLHVAEVRALMQPQALGVDMMAGRGTEYGTTAPASMMFVPLLAVLLLWLARRVNERRRYVMEQTRSGEKGTTTSAHPPTMTPSAAMDSNFHIMTALSTSLYTSASKVPLIALLFTLLELSGVSKWLIIPLYTMLLLGTTLHISEVVRETMVHEPSGDHAHTRQGERLVGRMGVKPGEWMPLAALMIGCAMSLFTVLKLLMGYALRLWFF